MNSFVNISNNNKYPENNNSKFITELTQPIQLNEKSEVALVEFYYLHDINIELGKLTIEFQRTNTDPVYQIEINVLLADFDSIFKAIQRQYDSLLSSIKYFNVYMRNVNDSDDLLILSCEDEILKDISNLIKCLRDLKDLLIDCKLHLVFSFIDVSAIIDSFKQELKAIFKFIGFQIRIEKLNLDHEINQYEEAVSNYLRKSKIEIDFNIRNRFTVDELYEFLLLHPITDSELNKNQNKIELLFKYKFTVIADKRISSNIKCNFLPTKIEFVINKNISPINNMYVHTNIISDEFKYSSFQPLLKIVNLDGNLNEFVHKTFDNPQYKKVNKTFINSIEIEIKDSFNRLISFNKNPQLKLHFKNIKI